MLLTLRTPEAPDVFARMAEDGPLTPRTVDLPTGRAHLFRPSADAVAVVLEVDPDLSGAGNVEPYSGSGLMGEALGRFFADADGGADDPPLFMEARISVLPCASGSTIPLRLFGPLGYTVDAAQLPLDPERSWMGESRFCAVTLRGCQQPRDLLSHLRVLLPLLDPRAGGVDAEEGARLWNLGQAWLETHPEHARLERLLLRVPPRRDVHDRRHEAVVAALKESGARRVLDLGCGAGLLLRRLLLEPQFEEVVGVEVARDRLAEAAAGLEPGGRGRVLHGSVVYRDARLAGFDAAAVVEVLEHLDPPQLAAFEAAVWETARPATVVLTTPNVEFNTLFPDLPRGGLRHPDHRFEWTRAEFGAWAKGVAARHGYAVRFADIGPVDTQVGPLTQMAVFNRLPCGRVDGDATAPALDAVPALHEVAGERAIRTRAGGDVHVTEEEAAAALEATSRFTVDKRWLVYLPPTTPAVPAGAGSDALEHPSAALAYYQAHGVSSVALQELHAGTRVAVVVCRDQAAARRRFKAAQGETGAVYSGEGQSFFKARPAEEAFLGRIRAVLNDAGTWEALGTDWLVLEGVIGPGMPLMPQVDPVHQRRARKCWGAAAQSQGALEAVETVLVSTVANGVAAGALLARTRERNARVASFLAACWRFLSPVRTPDALWLAPVRLLAGERGVYAGYGARWHRERLDPLCRAAPRTLHPTEQRTVDLADPTADAVAAAWWKASPSAAGILVWPLDGAEAAHSPYAPALKCRSVDALRLVYGPEHSLLPDRGRLRDFDLARVADQAAREWTLSIEGLQRLVQGESLARVHECVLGALGVKTGS